MGQWWSQSDQKPKPGDLIEIFQGVYEHWAVYVGDDWVVHVTVPTGDKKKLRYLVHNPAHMLSVSLLLFMGTVPGAVSSSLMSVPTEKAMVVKEKLQEVVGNDTCRISLDRKYTPHLIHIIVEEADRLAAKRMKYSVISKNFEHFENELRYGKAESCQVKQDSF
ncbi:phospholipase A and acyltransferase 4-like [Pagrus major]|uniref:phospholipase A and acyltransferase 4-like n=1 Tax=Pagrus major TaxID=143350 RepID=UPI003CC85812